MSKKAREKPAEAGSASVSPYGSVLGYELVTSQPNRLINLIWPECRTWFIGPCQTAAQRARVSCRFPPNSGYRDNDGNTVYVGDSKADRNH